MVKHPPRCKEAPSGPVGKKSPTPNNHDAIDDLNGRNVLSSPRKTGPCDALIIGESHE